MVGGLLGPLNDVVRDDWIAGMLRESRMSIKLLVAEDHRIVREGLRSLIASEPDMEIVGEAENGTSAVRMAEELQPDVVIMDVAMPLMSGIEATALIREVCPGVRIVALSAYDRPEFVMDMLKAGASGYLLKDTAFSDLVRAIRVVVNGECYLCPQVATIVLARQEQASGAGGLDLPDQQLIRQLAEGKTAREIAETQRLSIKTVEGRRRRIMAKLGLDSIAALVRYAVDHGLVSEDAPPSPSPAKV